MWHKKYDKCVQCGETRVRYMAKGLCGYCYSKNYQNDPAKIKRVKAQKHAYYQRSGGKEGAKQMREERWFSGKREAALKRDGYKCTECGSEEHLVVHHKDGNGRGSKKPNNRMSNLQTLCRSCHAAVHGKLDVWSKVADACIDCGRTDRKHNARGYCFACYNKHRARGEYGNYKRSVTKQKI